MNPGLSHPDTAVYRCLWCQKKWQRAGGQKIEVTINGVLVQPICPACCYHMIRETG